MFTFTQKCFFFLLCFVTNLVFAGKNFTENRDRVVDDKLDPFKEEFYFRRQIIFLILPPGRKFGYD